MLRLVPLALLVTLAACSAAPPPDEPPALWTALQSLCGQAFEGQLTEGTTPSDSVFAQERLVMHVRECSEEAIRVPFHVGADRSRTWVFTRLPGGGLRLKHDHRHEDGSEDAVTQYGGDSRLPAVPEGATPSGTVPFRPGLALEFPADAFTADLLPAAATNVWTVAVVPGQTYTYALRREGTDRRVRVAFDLTRPVAPPPAPWGAE